MIAFARVGALVMLLPGFGERAIPVRQRLALALLLTLMLLPIVREHLEAAKAAALPRLMGELLLGVALGLCARLALAALDVAASLASQTIGLSFAQMYDPTQGQQAEMLTGFFRMLGVCLIFATDLHHVALAGIADSYTTLPVGAAPAVGDVSALMVRLVGEVFHAGVRIAAPFLVFGLVFNLGLGLASRLAPQVQLFFLTMPAGILLGLMALSLMLGPAGETFLEAVRAVLALLFPGAR